MQPKVVATIRSPATNIEAAAREYALAMAMAVEADEGGDILVGPICTIAHGRAVQIIFARPAGALIALNVVPRHQNRNRARAIPRPPSSPRSAAMAVCKPTRRSAR